MQAPRMDSHGNACSSDTVLHSRWLVSSAAWQEITADTDCNAQASGDARPPLTAVELRTTCSARRPQVICILSHLLRASAGWTPSVLHHCQPAFQSTRSSMPVPIPPASSPPKQGAVAHRAHGLCAGDFSAVGGHAKPYSERKRRARCHWYTDRQVHP